MDIFGYTSARQCRRAEKKGLIEMDDTGDYYCDGWVVANLDSTKFIDKDFWTGNCRYNENKKNGLYD